MGPRRRSTCLRRRWPCIPASLTAGSLVGLAAPYVQPCRTALTVLPRLHRAAGRVQGCAWSARGNGPMRSFGRLATAAFAPSLIADKPGELGVEVLPFGDGGADNETPRPKLYTHGPCRSALATEFVVAAGGWKHAGPGSPEHRALAARTLEVLRAHGFVVLEGLLPTEAVAALEAEAEGHLDSTPRGFAPQPLRAHRSQLHLPYAGPWSADWLIKNELILEVVASYVCNDVASGRSEDEQQGNWIQWVTSGASLDWFRAPENRPVPGELLNSPPPGCSDVGSAQEHGPWLGRAMVTRTPPGSPPQKRHRDIILPGPAAQLTIQVALTPLVANNGPLGYFPGSHVMRSPGYEVVANPPSGSVVLYDSFVEHRGIENHTPRMRYAMYYEFETRGIFSGYTDMHFGAEAAAHTLAFRQSVDPELRRLVRKLA
mmetsp:Transcript_13855/g.43378  ORF Transcript_13855/g.43378 Transcript_13855/m.43378 type:complete len:430 (-) Transcript_13855:131-1420(-)